MYVSQIIMLYTLNLYSAACQLCLNKTGRKKVTKSKNYNKGKYLEVERDKKGHMYSGGL